jgi:thymidine kinase
VTITQKYIYIKERFVMVYLITGPKGSGKTQQIIELANEKVKTTNGNVVLIKKSHRDTSSVNFNIRAICMADYSDITTLEELVGFLYGMVAGNHDIETIFIDGVLKQVDISVDNLPVFLQKINKISKDNSIEFYISVSLEKDKIPEIDSPDYKVLS